MDFETLVAARRSVRAYKKGVTVTEEQIEKMVTCAQNAPSWKNSQTGRYYAAITPEAVEKVRSALSPYNANNTANASAYVVATFVTNRSGFERDGSPTNELGNEWGAYDLGLQNGLLLLKAKEEGLDSLVMGLRDSESLRKALDIPETEAVMSVIALGVRDIEPEKPPRKDLAAILKIR